MERRVFTSHDGGVRWQREWDLRGGVSEPDTLTGKRIEVRSLRSLRAAALRN